MTIVALAEQYNQFQHSFGQGAENDYEGVVEKLFSPTLKKLANGNVLASQRAELLTQLNEVKDIAGKWTIESQEIIPSLDNTKCTIKYSLSSQKAGRFEIIAIITAPQGRIDRIDEIFYQEPH